MSLPKHTGAPGALPLPLLVIVSGPPGAGKSTFAQELSARLGVPLLSMDLVKGGAAFTMTGGVADETVTKMGGPAGQIAFAATYDALAVCLGHGVSVIVEKAWQRGRAEAELRHFLSRSRAVQVHITASEPVAVHRLLARPSRDGTANVMEIKRRLDTGELKWDDFGPLELGIPLHVVITDDGNPVDLAPVEAFLATAMSVSGRPT
jgi:predicted kinase